MSGKYKKTCNYLLISASAITGCDSNISLDEFVSVSNVLRESRD